MGENLDEVRLINFRVDKLEILCYTLVTIKKEENKMSQYNNKTNTYIVFNILMKYSREFRKERKKVKREYKKMKRKNERRLKKERKYGTNKTDRNILRC